MTPETHAKAQEVALYLGRPWRFNHLYDSCWSFQIIDGSGRGFHLGTDKTMFRISGLFPVNKTGRLYSNEERRTIGVSMHRPAKDIAADIHRRLLPHYLETFTKAAARHRQEQEAEEMRLIVAQAIARIAPHGRICPYVSRSAKTIYFDGGKAELWSSGDVSLEMKRLSVDKAMQIIAVLNSGSGA
ncbi:MAG: hypothetical protein VKL39_04895 [Leptolyngbyaceae bacterium]|nr:hypothetical protein [Leptolyngbyaceae bacterium]